MAIPHRTTITCPACGTSEDRIIADTSYGPCTNLKPRTGPVHALLGGPLWKVTKRPAEDYINCTTCGKQDFISLAAQAIQGV